ncbi:MAG: hypothetical protein N2654_02440 [Deltaproteobacteria bacterium]|nr:hypothetical protein [Deltaproteobacteria bacterium]
MQKGELRKSFDEAKYFFKGALKNLRQVGTILPTSKWIAQAMCKPLRKAIENGQKPTVLEVGAGTGSVTKEVLSLISNLRYFVTCECNPFYCSYLESLIKSSVPQSVLKNGIIELFQGYIEDYTSDASFDFILCAVPFLCFDVETNKGIMRKLKALSHPETIMTHIEHLGSRPVKLAISKERRQFFRVVNKAQIDTEIVFKNYFPMVVVTIKPYYLDI